VAVGLIAASRFFAFDTGPGKYDQFAQCLSEKGAKFYGAFWCPHCQEQKRMFGKSVGLLPYVECSLPDGKTQTQVCKDAGIESYPTWIFADGSKVTGEQQLASLAEKTGCTLP
jgi:thiol-disulfide isomerase/thioredoxin